MFDVYGSHVSKGTEVFVEVDGLQIQDFSGSHRKVSIIGLSLNMIPVFSLLYSEFIYLKVRTYYNIQMLVILSKFFYPGNIVKGIYPIVELHYTRHYNRLTYPTHFYLTWYNSESLTNVIALLQFRATLI